MTALASSTAPAQSLVWLGPDGVVSPDGFQAALVRRQPDGGHLPPADAQLSAQGATLEEPDRSSLLRAVRVIPEPSAREVVLTADLGGQRAEARWQVGPPGSRVELQLDPPAPVKGRQTEAALTIRLLRPDGAPDEASSPPVLQANVGTLEPPVATGPGIYRARYVLPTTRYPEVAVIVGFAPWPQPASVHGAFGALRVPLATAITLPGVGEKNAQMTLELAGQKFGPVQVGPSGRFELDVVVPPGYRYAKGTAVDRAGNRRTSTLDLQLPPTDQLACVMNPRRLPADGAARARVLCAASDPYGKAVTNAKVTLTTKRGRVTGPRVVGGDLLEWLYVAPGPPSLEQDQFLAQWKQAGPLSKEELSVDLQQGPAVQLTLESEEPLVHQGGQVTLHVRAKDSFGRPRPGATVEVLATGGTPSASKEVEPGHHVVTLEMPLGVAASVSDLRARVFGPSGTQPTSMQPSIEEGRLVITVADQTGAPVPGQEIEVAGVVHVTEADGTVRVAPPAPGSFVDARHRRWPGLALRVHGLPGGRIFPAQEVLRSVVQRSAVKVGPPVPVIVRVEVKGREVTYWVEDPKGHLLPDRKVEIFVTGATRGAEVQGEQGRRHFTVGGAGRASVSVADVLTGVTAVAVVRP